MKVYVAYNPDDGSGPPIVESSLEKVLGKLSTMAWLQFMTVDKPALISPGVWDVGFTYTGFDGESHVSNLVYVIREYEVKP